MKIDRRKKYFMVLDVETANSTDYPLVYDLGFGVYDKKGNEYFAKSFVITDTFDFEKNLMKTSYYNEKLPKYYEELKSGKRERTSIFQAKKLINQICKQFKIKEIYAYNASFDLRALNTSIRFYSKSKIRYFFPFGTEICDIWHIACQTLCLQKTFQFENVRNANGNLITNAERLFGYIEQKDFQEEHTGLEDTRVEAQILVRCLASHQKIDKKINRACWRIPQLAV